MKFNGLDHLAIAVTDTEEALKLWCDTFGFPVVCSEIVNDNSVKLTHLDLGNTHLQLVEPLTADHPLQAWLAKHGNGLHHFCLKVANVDQAVIDGPVATSSLIPHEGTDGKRALFFAADQTDNIIVEITGK